MDRDQFNERAAIAEFDGGLTRFDAETMAAQEQGLDRWEAIGDVSGRLVERARHQRALARKQRPDDLPGMQPTSSKEG